MSDLLPLLDRLRQCRFVDLTQAFDPSIPHCDSFAPEERLTLYHYEEGVGLRGSGFLAHECRHAGQWGTHVDPPAHFPGWSADVLRFLAEERSVTAIGHDTTDTDPGSVVSRREAALEDYWLGQDKWQLELLANLGEVSPSGAILVASWLKPKQGSGFPARAFAVISQQI